MPYFMGVAAIPRFTNRLPQLKVSISDCLLANIELASTKSQIFGSVK